MVGQESRQPVLGQRITRDSSTQNLNHHENPRHRQDDTKVATSTKKDEFEYFELDLVKFEEAYFELHVDAQEWSKSGSGHLQVRQKFAQ
ncbi:3703_t:CDS:2 [Paraglomus brasilianum]|uniref:3703_t:CDS:1 n=1 Tax=Paraglomus brasilianum TaxID=144538 RepID=A0A9N9BP10_9GLOM|nr:3703_t:CDS:2 [Paraglomus brasilianum]